MAYNGYTNYETWVFGLYEEEYIRHLMRENKGKELYYIAQEIKQAYDEDMILAKKNLPDYLFELLEAAFQEVDFYDLVETYNYDEGNDNE